MFSILRQALRIGFLALMVSILSVTSFGQTSLRTAVDYDGDGRADKAVFRPSTNTWYVQRSTQGFVANQFGISSSDVPCPGDYDGDGKGDLCVWRDTDGTFYYLKSTTQTIGVQQFGQTGDEPVARNWDNGDGVANKTDFGVVRRSNNQLTWYTLGNGVTGAVTKSFQFGLATDYAIPGDYDGDGRFDYAVQRSPSTAARTPSTVYMQTNPMPTQQVPNPPGVFSQLQYGLNDDLFVPGDYDNDNKTDLAVVRDNNGSLIWYVRNAATGAITGTQYGATATDFPVQNDYDGDGKTDLAVWRDSNGTYYVLGSAGTNQVVQFGQAGDFAVASYDSH